MCFVLAAMCNFLFMLTSAHQCLKKCCELIHKIKINGKNTNVHITTWYSLIKNCFLSIAFSFLLHPVDIVDDRCLLLFLAYRNCQVKRTKQREDFVFFKTNIILSFYVSARTVFYTNPTLLTPATWRLYQKVFSRWSDKLSCRVTENYRKFRGRGVSCFLPPPVDFHFAKSPRHLEFSNTIVRDDILYTF